MRSVRAVGLLIAGFVAIEGAALDSQAAQQALPRRSSPPVETAVDPRSQMRIAAVVNDDVISVYDIISRLRMVLSSSNIPDTPDARQKVESQVLRSLVDERLQLQEAKKQNVVATDDEINTALGQIEKQNNMRPGQLNEFLKARGIDRSSLINQMTASIVWAKLVRRQASQTVEISDDDIDDAMKRLKEHAGEPQSHVAEIFLAVDNPSQDAEVRALAEKLSQQMRQGARFSAVAQQFSQSATAAVGGDIGWVRPDQLPPELAKTIGPLRPGELSSPVRTNGGYYLLLVLDRRTGSTGGGAATGPVYDVVQVVFPLPPKASEAMKRAAAEEAVKMRGAAKSCPEMLRIGKEKAPQLTSEGKVGGASVTPQLRELLDKMSPGQVTEPILQRNGVGIIMLCGKEAEAAPKGALPNREEVFDSLLRQRLDTVSRRYLRDLRRSAYVDVRI
jgi:peptidyl-prolyl cis-trans isomerase SurA